MATGAATTPPGFLNRPNAKAHDFPWKTTPEPQNPALRGIALHIGAILFTKLGFVQSIFWSNAGFDRLRDIAELEKIPPRYDPTVIRTSNRSFPPVADVDVGTLLLGEDWTQKAPPSKVHYSILDFHEAYKSGRTTPTAVANALLPLICRDVEEPTKHSIAFLESRVDLILAAAEASTKRYQAGKPLSPLDGVPIAVKDECDVTGYKKSYASRIDHRSKTDSTTQAVAALQNAGAILMGKTNMHENGCDITSNNPIHGTPLNPNNDDYYTGGSSGGSAYAVAAGLMPLAQGNDAGGSIRVPSNFCGLYGLKPTHDRVGTRPTPNIAESVSVCGPIAANMVDLEIGFRIMAEPDPLDPKASLYPRPQPVSSKSGAKRVIGIFRPWFDRADPIVKEACQKTLDWLVSKRDYTVLDITLPLIPEGQIAHAITVLSEISSAVPASKVHQLTAPNKILLTLARQHSAVDLIQAAKVRHVLMQHLAHLYTEHPGLIIATPTTAEAGWRIEPADLSYGLTNANKQLRNMSYVWLANFSGCPAITVPCGFAEPEKEATHRGKIPIGLMGMAEWCADEELIAFGYDCEQYLDEGFEGGRIRPANWTDILAEAKK